MPIEMAEALTLTLNLVLKNVARLGLKHGNEDGDPAEFILQGGHFVTIFLSSSESVDAPHEAD